MLIFFFNRTFFLLLPNPSLYLYFGHIYLKKTKQNNVQKNSVIWNAQGLNSSVVLTVNSCWWCIYSLDYEFLFSEALHMCGCVENMFLHCSFHLLLLDSHNGVNFMAGSSLKPNKQRKPEMQISLRTWRLQIFRVILKQVDFLLSE